MILTVACFNRAMADDGFDDTNDREREFGLLTISLYKDHPELWNPRCNNYSNKFVRRKALQTITKALKEFKPFYTEQLLRKKINILRTNFNKEYKKREQMRLSGQNYEGYQSLWYYDELLFVKDEECANTAMDKVGERYKMKPTNPRSKNAKKRKLPTSIEKDLGIVKLEPGTLDGSSNDDCPKKHSAEPSIVHNSDPLAHNKSEIYHNVTEHDAVGINVAKKLAKMEANQAIIAENIINNVLRRGLQQKLNDDTDLCDIGCGRVKYTLDNRILMKKS